MRPLTSSTGQIARRLPVTRIRSSTSFTLRGPLEWRNLTLSPGRQLRSVATALESGGDSAPAPLPDTWILNRSPKAGAEISPGITSLYSATGLATPSLLEVGSSTTNLSSRGVRSAFTPWASSHFRPARPVSARSRKASVD